ncbi:hypothetical protein BURMUCGD1_4278 [Burkholderia multivorans CGD1]|nr:hypothetical protein BURMUCGD1_4278 [Burkholderia multivorans CGD1]
MADGLSIGVRQGGQGRSRVGWRPATCRRADDRSRVAVP